MEIRKERRGIYYQLHHENGDVFPITKRRMLLGRSDACDIILKNSKVTAIHAVLEGHKDFCQILDMNSTNGTFINSKKIISEKVYIGDKVNLGGVEFVFEKYIEVSNEDVAVDMLHTSPRAPRLPKKVNLDKISDIKSDDKIVPRILYPLSLDPKADQSEYIFEEADTIYPIFKYDVEKTAVEIIILFNQQVFSVDYLNERKGLYHLSGSPVKKRDIELVNLNKNERLPFIDISNKQVNLHLLNGYDIVALTDEGLETEVKKRAHIQLGVDDIIVLSRDGLQIFVRRTEAPPLVAPAHVFRKDEKLKKYLALTFLFVLLIGLFLQFYDVDQELKEEKNPERIATILLKKKISKAAVKNLSLNNKNINDKKSGERAKKEKRRDLLQKGNRKSKNTKLAKKAKPNKGKKNLLKDKVHKKIAKGKPRKSSSKKRGRKKRNKGKVDSYKSENFSQTLNSLMAKGGGIAVSNRPSFSLDNNGSAGMVEGESSASLKSSTLSKESGSITGSIRGKLDSTKGASGLVNKKGVLRAGIPNHMVVYSGMDGRAIRRILEENLPQFKYCYQKQLDSASNNFNGAINLIFTIGASGHVTKASPAPLNGKIPRNVRKCTISVLKGLVFPRPPGGGVVEVSQPLNFYRKRL